MMPAALIVYLLGVVPMLESWQESRSAAAGANAPLVLYVSRTDCSFCQRFETRVLGPVMASGLYADVVIREVVLDATPGETLMPLADSMAEFVDRFEVAGTPTVLFLDPQGSEIARRYVGYSDNDFSQYRLERSLRSARKALTARPQLSSYVR